jgi:hypothetical protein
MPELFQLNPDESILYRSSPSRKWYAVLWRIALGIFEVALFMLFSFTAFTSLAKGLLAIFLPADMADGVSRVLFQGMAPLLVIAWLVEDTVRIFKSELILTSQRIWTKGSPFAWTPDRETPLSEIRSMSAQRDTLFVHLKSTKKTQVHMFPDCKEIAKTFTQFTGRQDSI